MTEFDLIGDVHGHADALMRLLEKLGYDRRRGYYSHPRKTAIFVGDLIDRGPKIRETLNLVREMTERGAARVVMGNHEFNAIAYHTRHPGDATRFLRPHIEKNVRQHIETIRQVPPAELYDHLEWFRRLPMWLETEGLRVVHAGWMPDPMRVIDQARSRMDGITDLFMEQATSPGTELFDAVEEVLKGTEVGLPNGVRISDKDGHVRSRVRVKWWLPSAGRSYADYAIATTPTELPGDPLPRSLVERCPGYGPDAPPVFFGHYWLPPEPPTRLASNVACLDYSVARGGYLCAYRWQGESTLTDEHFVTTPCDI